MTAQQGFAKAFGRRLKKILTYKGLSQHDLAMRCGVTDITIHRYCHGENVPSAMAVAQMCEVLDLSADYLLGFMGD